MSGSETQLKSLHKKLTEKMDQILDSEEVTAAQLNVIRSFLSDNEITCNVETDDAMNKLKKKLQDRKNRIKGGSVSEEEKKELTNVVSIYGSSQE